jgi:hypothetical protein
MSQTNLTPIKKPAEMMREMRLKMLTAAPSDSGQEPNDPKYILNLLKSIITVSVETMTVVNGLPAQKEKKGL